MKLTVLIQNVIVGTATVADPSVNSVTYGVCYGAKNCP
jgi:hypothetical protein